MRRGKYESLVLQRSRTSSPNLFAVFTIEANVLGAITVDFYIPGSMTKGTTL